MLVHVELGAGVRLPAALALQRQEITTVCDRGRSSGASTGVHGEEVGLGVPDPVEVLPEGEGCPGVGEWLWRRGELRHRITEPRGDFPNRQGGKEWPSVVSVQKFELELPREPLQVAL